MKKNRFKEVFNWFFNINLSLDDLINPIIVMILFALLKLTIVGVKEGLIVNEYHILLGLAFLIFIVFNTTRIAINGYIGLINVLLGLEFIIWFEYDVFLVTKIIYVYGILSLVWIVNKLFKLLNKKEVD